MSEQRSPLSTSQWRTVFFGSSSLSLPILEALLRRPGRVLAVVTRPDRPAGRGRRLRPTPVKELAAERGIAVLEPQRVNAPEAVARVRELAADLIVLAGYGQILGGELLSLARVASLNVHPSLLPKYRGAAPVAWALLRGERETGVTVIRMTEEVDGGQILAQEATAIGEDETAGELEARLVLLGARLLSETLGRLEEALTQARPQGPAPTDGSGQAPRLTKEQGQVDWELSAEAICRRVRGLAPWPGAYSFLCHGGQLLRLKLLRVAASAGTSSEPSGTVVRVLADALLVQAGGGLVALREVQPAGGRPMDLAAFQRGHDVKVGDVFVGSAASGEPS
jgi:methionyl-tRNA formyltransferase